MEKLENTRDILLARYKRKSFLHRKLQGNEKPIYFETPKRKKIMGRLMCTHIDRQTESLWQNGDALCLVGLEGRGLL